MTDILPGSDTYDILSGMSLRPSFAEASEGKPPFSELVSALAAVEMFPYVNGIEMVVELAVAARDKDRGVFFLGNGASAAHASHMAADWLKNGRFRAQCFNDPALLTCLGNDLGYKYTMSEPLAAHARVGDIVFAVSSSGASKNILRAAGLAKQRNLMLITLTGMKPDNPLRSLGYINFYVPSMKYGIVETAHLAILHAILDRVMAD